MRRKVLLLIFSALACFVAYENHRRDREVRRVRDIERLGGFVDHGGRFIVLGGADITDATIDRLHNFPELEYLALPETAIGPHGISGLRQFKLLVGLEVLRTRVSLPFCAQVGALPNLRVLKMIQTTTTDECLPQLSQISGLEVLDLSNCPISGSGLRHLVALRNLRSLSLSSTNVGDEGVVHLRELPQLKFVELEHTRVTLSGISQLRDAFPACQIVY
ncbi:MAG TPA: hypothetical protein VFE62_27245 [Gemmataceae bacterium]|nr:hypothetical protein [Pirellulales bacterium]HZZ82224.1 hypothetical protein [Gemmataceae bacterium]